MKKFLLFLFILSFTFLGAEWIEVCNHETELFSYEADNLFQTEIEFQLDGYNKENIFVDAEEFAHITYFNEGRMVETGKPDLPTFTRLYAIPDEGVVSYQIHDFSTSSIANTKPYPNQELQSESQPQNDVFQIDEVFYSSNEIFPINLIEVGNPVIMRDVRLVPITVNAFQYNAAANEIIVYENIEFSITCDQNMRGENEKSRSKALSRTFEPIYSASIQNYELLRNQRDNYQDPCIIFVYPNDDNVLTNLEYLSDWKKEMGYEVHLASTATTGTSTTSIKNYIQNAYDTWTNPPEFVAFLGDVYGSYSIPTYFETWSGYGGEGDHPYSQLEGNDILADVILGRLSFSSITELQTIISKVLNYEKIPFMGNTAWYDKAIMVGDPTTSGPSCVFTKQSIAEMMSYYAPNIDCEEIYDGSFSNQMSNWLNVGASYFNYRGYLNMSGFNNTSITNLNNGLMLPFAVFLTCGTGSFADETSRSETFIRAGTPSNQKGAIAAIGTATWGTHTTFNNCVDLGIYYGLFSEHIYNPGGALLKGKLHLYNSFPNNPSNRVNIFSHWNSLMGDPSVHLWTAVPQVLSADYDSEINSGANFIDIHVYDDNDLPICEAWVCALSDDGQTAVRGYSDEEGNVYLENEFSNASSITLTITAHNFIPLQDNVDIISSATFVNIDDYNIDDDNNGTSQGNNDGMINPGETIELSVGLRNFGTNSANNVTATISSNNDNITIIDDNESFGNIAGNSVQYGDDDFDFSVNSTALGGTDIQLDMLIEDGSGSQWNDHIFLPVDGINLYANDYTIIDANGVWDPGETVELVVSLFNTGSIDASGISAQISCADLHVNLIDSLAVFETIQPGQTGNNDADTFEIEADIHAINGSQITFTLQLSNAQGYEQNVNLIVDLGNVTVDDPLGPDCYGYFAYDSGDSAYNLAPIYNWIEIDPSYGGTGTVINLNDNGDDGDVAEIAIPFDFNFYGYNYYTISVCSNGWIAPGSSAQASFMNTEIPGPHGPNPMIAAFWDDLRMGSGDVYYFYDSALNIFIVEWSRVETDWNHSEETFQVIIYDPDFYHTQSGDAEIVIQYHTVNNNSTGSYSGGVEHGQYATVGIEDQTALVGLGYTYNNSYPTAARVLQNEMAIKFTTVGGGAQSPPIMQLDQTSFDFIVQPGNTASQNLQISNVGEANLIYSFDKSYQNLFDRSRNQGGPDNYGYIWYDSNEPVGPQYNWRDISGIGTSVNFTHNDEGTSLMPIGFDFEFYGSSYSQFRINPNGWIGFGDDNTEWSNTSLPDVDAPRPAIMGFWDDLNPLDGGSVSYYSTSDSLVVWFDDVIHYVGNNNGTYDFEMIIYATGEMLFQYREVSGDLDTSTIGIQNADASDALLINYNNTYVQNELAIGIKKIVDWMDLVPSSGMVMQNETVTVAINVDTADLDTGIYDCNLILSTNDPDAQTTIIPVQMIVSSNFPQIELSQYSFDFGTVVPGFPAQDTLTIHNLGNQVLEVSNITTDLGEYSVDITNFSVYIGQSQDVVITFDVQDNSTFEGILTIYSNDPINSEVTVDLYGNSIYPVMELDPYFLLFGEVPVGEEITDTVLVENTGFEDLFITNITHLNDAYSISSTNFNVPVNETAEFYVTFSPEEEIEYPDTLWFESNALTSPIVTVSGEGIANVNSGNLIPTITKVYQNHPNPFNPQTEINYSISKACQVNIDVYNIKGAKVKTLVNEFQQPQYYSIIWNGKDDNGKQIASGVYFYKFKAGKIGEIKKMLLLK